MTAPACLSTVEAAIQGALLHYGMLTRYRCLENATILATILLATTSAEVGCMRFQIFEMTTRGEQESEEAT